ncbi:MAG: flagellar hook-associated protein FlgK [bacterium]
MVTLFGILNIGARGLFAAQSALDVTAHNLSNASTEGYTRQRTVQGTSVPITTTSGIFGSGVDVITVERIRDTFLDGQVRSAKSGASYYDEQESLFLRIESILNDTLTTVSDAVDVPNSGGLSNLISRFYSAWQELSNAPEASEVRSAVLESGATLADTLNLISEQLNQLRSDLNNKVNNLVDEVNGLATNIASLNSRISVAEVGEAFKANDLRDERDRQLDRLSEIVPIRVSDMTEGQVAVNVMGVRLVDGVVTNLLETRHGGGVPVEIDNVFFERQGLQSLDQHLEEGSLGGIFDARDRIVPGLADQIDTLARSLIQEVNRIHSAAAGTAGYSSLTSDYVFPSGAGAPTSPTTLDRIFNNPVLSPNALASAYPFEVQNGAFTVRVATENNKTRGTFSVNVNLSDRLTDVVERIDRADGVVSVARSEHTFDPVFFRDVKSVVNFDPDDVLPSGGPPLALSVLFPDVPVGFDAGPFQMEINLKDASGNLVDSNPATTIVDPFTISIDPVDTMTDIVGRIATVTGGRVAAEFVPDPNDQSKVLFRLRATRLGETLSVQGDTSGIMRAMMVPITDPTIGLVGGTSASATGTFAAGEENTDFITAANPNFSPVFPGPPPSIIGEGSFDVVVVDARGNVRDTLNIVISDGGIETISGVAAQLDAMADIDATVNANGELLISSDNDSTFFFRDDTTGLIDALGLDTIDGHGQLGNLPFQSGTFEIVVADERGKVTDIFNVAINADPATSIMSLSDIVSAINNAANAVGAPVFASLVPSPSNPSVYTLQVEGTRGHQFTFRSDNTLLLAALGFADGPVLEPTGNNAITGASAVTRIGDNIGPTVSAKLNTDGNIVISSTGTDEISFLNDTSYFLASAGLNTFFRGADAGSITINDDINLDPRLLATSKTGAPGDNQAALAISDLNEMDVQDGGSHGDYYRSVIARLGLEGAKISQFSEVNQRLLREFESIKEQISGVSLDEESINLVRFQKGYQAAARLISTVDQLIGIILQMGA